MTEDKIRVRVFDPTHGPKEVVKTLHGLECVEHLIFNILNDYKVGPIYRFLFGLKLTSKQVWLAPNRKVVELLKLSRKNPDKPTLELRMRYRPSFLSNLRDRDENAFNIIFAQLRHDFIHTKFSKEKKDFVLLDDAVLCLIATDLLRYALESSLNVEELFQRVNPNDFIPHKAAKWQRALLFRIRNKLNIQQSVEIGLRNCTTKDKIPKVKFGFIDVFLNEVCKDYGAETYRVIGSDSPTNLQQMELRLRFTQASEDSSCIIEYRPIVSDGEWQQLCDIYSISHGTLRNKAVELNRSNGRPFRVTFESNLHASSFLSLVDGYYRLMRKWHFNFCRDVLSPDLEFLRSIKTHGPIGSETSRSRLLEAKKPGTFLIRRCMEQNDRYIIEVLLNYDTRLIINVAWIPEKKVFQMIDYAANRAISLGVKLDQADYKSLKELVNDTQIQFYGEHKPPLQLKHWLPPNEYGDFPTLLLSMPKKRFKELIGKTDDKLLQSIYELPRFIPTSMLQPFQRASMRSGNGFEVQYASLNGEQDVVVKKYIEDTTIGVANNLIYQVNLKEERGDKLVSSLKPAQLRLRDWIFVRGPLFADSIGLDISSNSLIQEYFPLGRLDTYLQNDTGTSEIVKRSILCQLAAALLFLQERRMIHGKIRCHNVFLKSMNPFQIKLTDPLGTFDGYADQAFLPPEYVGLHGRFHVQEYENSIDVWAVGTTIWQVYTQGSKPPPGRFANTLTQPQSCPDEIWSTVEACWAIDPACRAAPQTIYRDLNDAFAWNQEIHGYDYISEVSNGRDLGDDTDFQEGLRDRQFSASGESFPGTFESLSFNSANGSTNNSETLLLTSMQHSNQYPRVSSLDNGVPKDANRYPNNPIINFMNLSHPDYDGSFKRSTSKGWTPVAIFKNNFKLMSKRLAIHSGLQSEWSSSKLSLSSCSTPSGSEITKLTDITDHRSISNAIDRSVRHVDANQLKLGREIGRGSSGVVLRGELSQSDGEQVVAVKCINNQSLHYTKQTEDLRREFEILKRLKHPNIVETLGFVDETYMMLIVEFLPIGSLQTKLRRTPSELLQSQPLQKYAIDIARGMEYLESVRVVHRDLALRNILVKSHNEVKICDFGLAQFLGKENHYKLKTDRALPLKWYSPETLETWRFTHKSDVWSYGIVLWEIYSGGCSPHYSGSYEDLLETLKHERLPLPKGCPDSMYKIMLSCWTYEPESRDSFKQVCSKLHAIASDYDKSHSSMNEL